MKTLWRACLRAFVLVLMPAACSMQAVYGVEIRYRGSGRVVDRHTGEALGGMRVEYLGPEGVVGASTTTSSEPGMLGTFEVAGATECRGLEATDLRGPVDGGPRYQGGAAACTVPDGGTDGIVIKMDDVP